MHDYSGLYGWVYANVPGYGAGHGTPALPLAAEWLANGGQLVDAGCGRQQFNAALRPLAPKAELFGLDVVRVDPVPAGVTFVQAPMWDLSAVPPVDVVASFDALEHLYPDDVERTFAAWASRLRPGGHLVCTICSVESGYLGPGGINLHPTVRPREWWLAEIGKHFANPREHDGLYLAEAR